MKRMDECDSRSAWSVGNGQVASAMTMKRECSKTLDCMHERQMVMVNGFCPKFWSMEEEVSPTLLSSDFKDPKIAVVRAFDSCADKMEEEIEFNPDKSFCHTPVAYDNYNLSVTGEVTSTVTTRTGIPDATGPRIIEPSETDGDKCKSKGGESGTAGMGNSVIRRMTPLECERLMGFPDGWTEVEWSSDNCGGCPDSPRYKACGNSFCANCVEWIGRRIDMVESEICGESN